MQPFHLAIPVLNLEETKQFYLKHFECVIGRQSSKWVDFDFYGHQLTVHLSTSENNEINNNHVDGKAVPVRHFGIILQWEQWHALADKLKQENIKFIIEPYIRFAGKTGEQATIFFKDPSGNALEFKSFKNQSQLFAKN